MVAEVVGGVGGDDEHLGAVDLGPQSVGPVGVEMDGGARLEDDVLAVELEAEPAADDVDPLLAAVAGRLGGTRSVSTVIWRASSVDEPGNPLQGEMVSPLAT